MRDAVPTLTWLAILCSSSVAFASGSELLPGGTRSVARGGAVHARPEDPHALNHNPAGLVYLADSQVMLDLELTLPKMCVDPYGYYGWGAYVADDPAARARAVTEFGDPVELDDQDDPTIGATYATTPLEEVCNSAPSSLLPHLAWAGKITDRWAIGAGFVAPTVVTGVQFGGDDGTVQTPYGPRPTPTRYTLVKQEVSFALNPTLGTAYRLFPWLSAGMTLQVLMVKAETTQVQNTVTGTAPGGDALVKATTQDFFIPAITFSLHSRPVPELNLMAGFRWSDSFRGSGDVVVETNTFRRGAEVGGIPFENDPVKMKTIEVPLPWQLTAGVRYAGRLSQAEENGDPLDTELWDVEVDFSYLFAARASQSTAQASGGLTFETRSMTGEAQDSIIIAEEDLPVFQFDRQLTDVYAVRVGASVSVLPKTLAILAGGFYESRGVRPEYADIDTFAFQRVGVGLGLMWRVGSFDLRAAYGHVFSETLDVAPPPHENVEDSTPGDPRSGFDQRVGSTIDPNDGTASGGVVLPDPDAPEPSEADAMASRVQGTPAAARPARVTNAGLYTASFDIISVGVVFHF